MTEVPSAEEQRLLDAYERLVDAAFRLDEPGVNEGVDELLQLVGAEDAAEVGFALTEEFMSEPDPAEDIDPEYVDAVRRLLLDAMLRLGRQHPGEAYVLAFLTAAHVAADEDDAPAAEEWASLAAQAATDEDDAAEAWAVRSFARAALERPAEALADARLADAGASYLGTRTLARWALLERLCDESDPEATTLALDAVSWCPPDSGASWVDALREAIERAVLNEEMRRENTGTRPHPASTGILRLALTDPSWVPESVGLGYMAAFTAWIDYRADDLSRLEETLAYIGDDPLDPDTAARVAMLRVLIPVGKADLAEIDRELRRAALAVRESSNPQIHAAFKTLADMAHSPVQGGNMHEAAKNFDANTLDGQAMLFLAELHESADATIRFGKPVPRHLVDRATAWLASPHETVALDTQAMMWLLGAMTSASIGDYPQAVERLDRAREIRSRLPETASQGPLLSNMIDNVAAALLLHGDTSAGVAALERLHAQQMREGRPALAFVTATQLALQRLQAGRPAESLQWGVTALEILADYRESLPGSSERGSIRAAQEGVYVTVLKAAAALPDPRVLAELLEYLRAQDMPVVHHDPEPTELPLAALLASPEARPVDPSEVVDAVAVGRPAPVRVPWGSLALEGLVRPPASAPVTLVVPRLPEAAEHALVRDVRRLRHAAQ